MNALSIKVDFRFVSLLLLGVIIVMLVIWRPWQGLDERTISVSGEAVLRAAPDEFIFYPTYQEKGKTSSEAIDKASKKGNAVVTKLKEIGVDASKIKTNVSSGSDVYHDERKTTDEITASYSITATVNDLELAKQVLAYLVTTNPLYGVSPQSTFSRETRNRLEIEARSQALAAAKKKAEQTATELSLKLGRVVSVSEPQWGGVIPLGSSEKEMARPADTATTPPELLTGEQEITYTVTVIYRIR